MAAKEALAVEGVVHAIAVDLFHCYSDRRIVIRAISSSVLSLLLVATLLWGGCISCPQFFMFPKAEKNCCNKAGQCERTSKTAPVKECKRMPLESQAFAHAELAAVVFTADNEVLVPAPGDVSHTVYPDSPVVEHSPPDLNVLHSTFLI